MYFNRMAKYYETQSSRQYSVDGDVTEWVKVPFNEARYGRDYCGGIVCSNTWFLIRDALAVWAQGQLDAGKTMAQIQDYLKTFDQQDRYDFDGDGNFNEPDGFIDHFQIVHAGGDEAAGDPNQGTDAIWSHRWNAQIDPFGTGPGRRPIGGVERRRRAARPTPTAASRSRTTRPASGSTTTRSSPRTAASASSRTSSATTSACPTSTTPPATPAAPRTPSSSGR